MFLLYISVFSHVSIIVGCNALADDPRKWVEVDYLALDATGNPKSNILLHTIRAAMTTPTSQYFTKNAERVRELIDNLELKHKKGKGYHNLEIDKFYPTWI